MQSFRFHYQLYIISANAYPIAQAFSIQEASHMGMLENSSVNNEMYLCTSILLIINDHIFYIFLKYIVNHYKFNPI